MLKSTRKSKETFTVIGSKMMYDYILVRPLIIETVKGKVIKPQQYEDKPEFGEVIEVGWGRVLENGETVPMRIKKGDRILFQKYSTEKIHDPTLGEDFLIIKEEDVRIIL